MVSSSLMSGLPPKPGGPTGKNEADIIGGGPERRAGACDAFARTAGFSGGPKLRELRSRILRATLNID